MSHDRHFDRRSLLWLAAGFALVAILVYGRVVGFPFVRWDDGLLITEQPAVRTISAWSLGWIATHYDPELYIPLTFFTYQIDWQLGGGQPWPFHTGNLILHTLNAFLLALAAARLLKHRWAGITVGLLFLVHPLHTEAVAWASARKDVLSTFFFLCSLLAYQHYREGEGDRWRRWSIAAFGIGLLAKVSVVMLPVVLLLIDWRDGRKLFTKEQLKEKWPYVALAVVFGAIAIGGKSRLVVATTLASKLLMACVSTAFYLRQMAWPMHFSLLYPFTADVTLATPIVWKSVLAVAILSAIVIGAWMIALKRPSRTLPRDIVAWSLLYFITLAPTFLNFAKGGDMDVYFASDRYAYIPSIGIFLLLGGIAVVFMRRQPKTDRVFGAVACAVLLALGWLSFQQLNVWQSTETLFRHVIAEYPGSSHVAHNNLGNAYRLQKQFAKAVEEYEAAIAIREHPKTLSNLGAVQRQTGDLPLAIATYQRALTIDPKSADAHFGIGIVLAQQGKFAEAEAHYKEAMQLSPDYEQVPTNLGALYAQQRRWQDAVDAYMLALAANPYYPDARYNLAIALDELGKKEDAEAAYREVIRVLPTSIAARINLGILLAETGDVDGSAEQFRMVLRIDPTNATAREALRQLAR